MFQSKTNLSDEELFEEIGKFICQQNFRTEPKESEQKDIFNELESVVVLAALKRTKGNKQAAANLLGLYRPRLYGMIKRHNIDEKDLIVKTKKVPFRFMQKELFN